MAFSLGRIDILLDFVNRIDRMTVHFDDDVTLSDIGLVCRTSRFDTDDHNTLVSLQAELVRHLGTQIVQLKTPPSLDRLGRFVALGLFRR
jgi:hypothetical protein